MDYFLYKDSYLKHLRICKSLLFYFNLFVRMTEVPVRALALYSAGNLCIVDLESLVITSSGY